MESQTPITKVEENVEIVQDAPTRPASSKGVPTPSADDHIKPEDTPASIPSQNSDDDEDENLAVGDDSDVSDNPSIKKGDLRKIGKGNKGYRKT